MNHVHMFVCTQFSHTTFDIVRLAVRSFAVVIHSVFLSLSIFDGTLGMMSYVHSSLLKPITAPYSKALGTLSGGSDLSFFINS